jgi:hypothetical protein
MEKESSYGATQAHMTVTFTKIIFMEQASTFGPMAEFTKENGSTTKWKAKVLLPGVMDVVTSENIRMIKNTDKELSNGQMAESILVNGIKVNNTVRAPT